MKKIIEKRLVEVMEQVVNSTEVKAQEIFERNNHLVFKKLEIQKDRVDDIVEYHGVQKKMCDDLF